MADLMEGMVLHSNHLTRRSSCGSLSSSLICVNLSATRSGTLVEDFARQVAAMVNVEYLPALTKIRDTLEQKYLKNRLQKEDNVKGAFVVLLVAGRTLLLIDDIYDSGKMVREAGRTLMQAATPPLYTLT